MTMIGSSGYSSYNDCSHLKMNFKSVAARGFDLKVSFK